MKNIIVTGCAGFIGYHLSLKLINQNFNVIGIDMLNDYYDIKLKKDRLKNLKNQSKKNINFKFYKINISNKLKLFEIFNSYKIDYIVNLAAQAGVRNSLIYPEKYLNYNIQGFLNILELSKQYKIKHIVYASTSSVYGLNKKYPFKTNHTTDHPLQFYAVTKKTNELMAHAYSSLYGLRLTGLRFFTVYGPWGRPDMALFKFTKNIIENKPIEVFNKGNHVRDFTYIDDIVNGILLSLKKLPKSIKLDEKIGSHNSYFPHKIYNLGCGQKIKLKKFISLIENNLNRKAKKINLPMQKGDVHMTSADISLTIKDLGYRPRVNVEQGIKNFIDWYKIYYKIK
jgi:UDP-glucuronate 4-epimerase